MEYYVINRDGTWRRSNLLPSFDKVNYANTGPLPKRAIIAIALLRSVDVDEAEVHAIEGIGYLVEDDDYLYLELEDNREE